MSTKIKDDKMNPEVKALWLAALRSGDYTQGTGRLHTRYADDSTTDEFCCLGVLCDLAVKDGVVIDVVVNEPHSYSVGTFVSYDSQSSLLPPAVQGWAGLSSEDPVVEYDDWESSDDETHRDSNSLSGLNDDMGWTLGAIADAIEANL